MSSDFNQCSFIGRLGRDPEVKSFQSGGRVCNLSIAVGESWKDKTTGERKERVEWVPVTIQNDGLVTVAERYLRKGSKVLVQGQWRTRKWTDRDGNERYSTECVLAGFGGVLKLLDSKGDGQARDSGRAAQPADDYDDLSDEVPF